MGDFLLFHWLYVSLNSMAASMSALECDAQIVVFVAELFLFLALVAFLLPFVLSIGQRVTTSGVLALLGLVYIRIRDQDACTFGWDFFFPGGQKKKAFLKISTYV